MRKQLDPRIPILITNNVKKNNRSFIVLVGDKGRDQIVNLHFLLSQARVSARPSVLWCYKKDLGFTSHRKKREEKIKRDVKRGIREANDQNPFEIFVTVTDIRYTYYKESEKILGNTYGMCVLQDFEAITPNLLARTIETVEGGGLIVLLLKTMTSLKQLYSMTMDVHSRYRTSSHDSVVARFNERFILSLGSSEDCLFLDDELNVLPISRGKDITPIDDESLPKTSPDQAQLEELRESLADTTPAGPLLTLAKTLDQAQALLTFIEAISEKTLSSTVTLTAARGRGKSAALGLAIASALAHGYSNIFVTSPSPENLKTLFEFIFKGMDALGYEEHLDYDIMQSVSPEGGSKGAIVRVDIFKNHRQTIQYIQPQDAHVLGQAELVIIDEAAAIPLPLVRNLIGPYLVFLASTINGYEGTGRSLSLKLIQQLRDSTRPSLSKAPAGKDDDNAKAPSKKHPKPAPKSRTLREIKLSTPIRYGAGDRIEKWLYNVLCLNATTSSSSHRGTPHPSTCTLFYVNRDTLFSYHPASEVFLQRMMALYVASHYKNSPNDLQMLSDAPAHHLFVLLPPIKDDEEVLPEPLVVLQVALEGGLSKETVMDAAGRGKGASGDMIPWVVSGQFLETGFAALKGGRVVRVACDPDYSGMGYGSRALEALNAFYSGEYFNFDETEAPEQKYPNLGEFDPATSDLRTETPTVRAISSMPPLLQRLSERKPEILDYLGVSYGLTGQLLRFWKRAGYVPLYLRQSTSELTGEHSCVMVRSLGDSQQEWLGEFAKDFRKRFLSLLSYKFREFGSVTALSLLEAVNAGLKAVDADPTKSRELNSLELSHLLTPFDLKRLEAYANNMLDYHAILDLVPTIATLFFDRRLTGDGSEEGVGGDVRLSAVQSAILLGLGLQRKEIDEIETELSLPVSQTLALFSKVVRKITKRLVGIQKAAIGADIPDPSTSTTIRTVGAAPIAVSLEEELNEAGEGEMSKEKQRQRELIDSLDLKKYAINDASTDWSMAEGQIGKGRGNTVVSVKAAAGQKRKSPPEELEKPQDKKTSRRGKKQKR
ncbi:GNAT acetyltransferase 2-domain-containing protein [Roridomyces roridus]|uniref:RNA cytidine acetyltransferase n=1 Tax=Roridomyces roridus TaxID=1738132 RepID=A0AAD7B3L9_9AGAR|nr:GNAT acetyltransferase 2-domain-containing protein [Roridomyces roridus]